MTAVDDWMPPDAQQRWLTDLEWDDLDGVRRDDSLARANQAEKYQRYLQMPYHEEVSAFLRVFIAQTVPAVMRAEAVYWSLSCKTELDVYVRVNVGGQTTFQAFYAEEDDTPLFVLFLPRKLLSEGLGVPIERAEAIIPFEFDDGEEFECLIAPSDLVKGDRDQMCLTVTSGEDAAALVDMLLPQIRAFHLRLMRGGKTLWANAHCWDLADRLLGGE